MRVVNPAELDRFDTFAAFSPTERAQLAGVLSHRRLASGTRVCSQGEEGRSCFILLEGAVQVEREVPGLGVRQLGTLLPGALFGQLSLIDGAPRLATCRAVGPVRVAELERDVFLRLCGEGSRFALAFQLEVARALTRQLRQGNQAFAEAEAAADEESESAALTDWLDALLADPRRGGA